MKIAGIIPARYASTRFPGKPLADIKGKSMIMRVYEQAAKVQKLDEVVVATDDQRIFKHVIENGGKAVMTSPDHPSGTSRCAEAIKLISRNDHFDSVINIQGDEPFIRPEQIGRVAQLLCRNEVQIASLYKKITTATDLFDPNIVKAIVSNQGKALYFSRQAVPFVRNVSMEKWLELTVFYKHIGIYGYRVDTLFQIIQLTESPLEKAELLEQLRWLYHGFDIYMEETHFESFSIDTPEDLSKFMNNL